MTPTIQTYEDLEKSYQNNPDPWGYQRSHVDKQRRQKIVQACERSVPMGKEKFSRALDICCGEGWITKDLPAYHLYGYDVPTAMSRFPKDVKPWTACQDIQLGFDLVVCTGALYYHYDWLKFLQMIKVYSTDTIVLSHIKTWLVKEVESLSEHYTLIDNQTFGYERPENPEYLQYLQVWKRK